MKSIKAFVTAGLMALLLGGIGFSVVQAQTPSPATSEATYAFDCKPDEPLCIAVYFDAPAQQIATLTPSYQPMALPAASRQVTYVVETRGAMSANVNEFKQVANQTLNDSRGWNRLGASFKEVTSGGDFTLVLSEAGQVPSFSPNGCDSTYSCVVGRYVIINQDRWQGATPSWNDAGGSLTDYRRMVINHETGHWLGHGHATCPAAGTPAPVMQQQSINLQGCTFNPWPLSSEMHSSRLGV